MNQQRILGMTPFQFAVIAILAVTVFCTFTTVGIFLFRDLLGNTSTVASTLPTSIPPSQSQNTLPTATTQRPTSAFPTLPPAWTLTPVLTSIPESISSTPTAQPVNSDVTGNPLVIKKAGFFKDFLGIGYAFIVENPNPNLKVEDSKFQAAAFDENGNVVGTDESWIHILGPNEQRGVASTIFVPDDVKVARVEVQINPGQYIQSPPIPIFTSESASYFKEDNSFLPDLRTFTGVIINPYSSSVETIIVAAIAYDNDGNIIGGGSTILDFIPANGKSAVSIMGGSRDTPTRIELYAALTSSSVIK